MVHLIELYLSNDLKKQRFLECIGELAAQQWLWNQDPRGVNLIIGTVFPLEADSFYIE